MQAQDTKSSFISDLIAGLSAMLVALPSAVAFGLLVYASLGSETAGLAALTGIVGTMTLAFISPVFGGTHRLITAPCAPAAAVLGAYVSEQFGIYQKAHPMGLFFLLVSFVVLFSGLLQVLFGLIGGGKLIKYIPYTVVSGYLSGVGILIFLKQWPKFLGLSEKMNFISSFPNFDQWNLISISIGVITMLTMIYSKKISEKIPGPILALSAGLFSYFCISVFQTDLQSLNQNPLIIGTIGSGDPLSGLQSLMISRWDVVSIFDPVMLRNVIMTSLTLSVLLSIDTLKTCVIVDALTKSRHDSNKELIGQGLGNIVTGIFGGVGGAGTMGATLVNMSSGAKTKFSGIAVGFFALAAFFLLSKVIAWIPIASLAGILMVIAYRMIDKSSFKLLIKKTTRIDFMVILAVICTAIFVNLIAASGVGLALSIILFIREQIRGSVIRKSLQGHLFFSKKRRLPEAVVQLEKDGNQILIIELQGNLFFGTTDKLLMEIDNFIHVTKYLILDMHRVQSMDFTAGHRIEQLAERLKEKGGYLILTRIPQNLPSGADLKDYLNQMGVISHSEYIKTFRETSDAHEWAENEVLSSLESGGQEAPLEIKEIELFSSLSQDSLDHLSHYLKVRKLKPGEKIFSRGDIGDELYCIRSGEVRIVLPVKDKISHHLATFGRGDFFGDMSFLDHKNRSADAVASLETEVFVLSRKDFDKLSETHRRLSSLLFENLAKMMSSRLRVADMEIRTLEEN